MKKSQTRKTVTLPQTNKKIKKQSQKLFHIEENLRLTKLRIADLMDDIALLKRDLKEKDNTISILWKTLFRLSNNVAVIRRALGILFGLFMALGGSLLLFEAKSFESPYLFWGSSIAGAILVISGFYQVYKSTDED
nr:MAG TPA: Inner membrane protein YgaP protein [Caudoviricetes sp.]